MDFKFECPLCKSDELYPYNEINLNSLHKIVNYQCMQCFKRLQYHKQFEFLTSSKSFGFMEKWVHEE